MHKGFSINLRTFMGIQAASNFMLLARYFIKSIVWTVNKYDINSSCTSHRLFTSGPVAGWWCILWLMTYLSSQVPASYLQIGRWMIYEYHPIFEWVAATWKWSEGTKIMMLAMSARKHTPLCQRYNTFVNAKSYKTIAWRLKHCGISTIRNILSEIRVWISNFMSSFRWNVIPYPCFNFQCNLVEQPMKLGHGWIITSHILCGCDQLLKRSKQYLFS